VQDSLFPPYASSPSLTTRQQSSKTHSLATSHTCFSTSSSLQTVLAPSLFCKRFSPSLFARGSLPRSWTVLRPSPPQHQKYNRHLATPQYAFCQFLRTLPPFPPVPAPPFPTLNLSQSRPLPSPPFPTPFPWFLYSDVRFPSLVLLG